MNIIFEGIDASGKTTLMKRYVEYLEDNNTKNVKYVKEIEDSPLTPILKNILEDDPFFKNHKNFKTSIYETFLLASAFFYKQELLRDNTQSINLYDRDIITLLCSQKVVLEDEYGDSIKKFYKNFEECIFFDLKKIDLLVYISIPIELSFKRVKTRDNITLTLGQQDFLIRVKHCFEKILLPSINQKGIPIIYINGEDTIENNIQSIEEKLQCNL